MGSFLPQCEALIKPQDQLAITSHQAKAAYEACMNASSDDEEGTSNSDNDEDSNKSVSTYTSEDSNIS